MQIHPCWLSELSSHRSLLSLGLTRKIPCQTENHPIDISARPENKLKKFHVASNTQTKNISINALKNMIFSNYESLKEHF